MRLFKLLLLVLVTFSLQVGQAKVSNKRISLEEILNSAFNNEDLCIRDVGESLFTYKSCMNVGRRIENTLVDVANFTTFHQLNLSKKSPYTNCRAKKSLNIRFRYEGKAYMLKHRLVESAKIKYGQASELKKDLVSKIKERSHTIKLQLLRLPHCSS